MKKLSNFKLNKNGFTLIELMVVIAIIGVLVTIVIVAIDPAKQIKNSQDARMRSDLQAIKAAFQLYYNDNKSYPVTKPYTGGSCWSSDGTCSSSGTIYMKQVPKDTSGNEYNYQALTGTSNCSTAPCSDYAVGAKLNNSNGTDDSNTITKCSGTAIAAGVLYEVCND